MITIDEYEFRIPSRYLTVIHNSDYSIFSEQEEEENFNKFMEDVDLLLEEGQHGVWSVPEDGEEPFFSWTNDVTRYGDDCYDLTFVVLAPEH